MKEKDKENEFCSVQGDKEQWISRSGLTSILQYSKEVSKERPENVPHQRVIDNFSKSISVVWKKHKSDCSKQQRQQ